MKISFTLNGERRQVHVSPNEILLEVLRYKMGVKSPKSGCDTGDCGACTVILNGKAVRSCLIFAVEVDGQDILSLEGLSPDGLSPLQQALLEKNAFQCGYCAPGMILSAHELLSSKPHPTEEEIKEAISGNLCRCTGYQPIIDAIKSLTEKR